MFRHPKQCDRETCLYICVHNGEFGTLRKGALLIFITTCGFAEKNPVVYLYDIDNQKQSKHSHCGW